MPHFIPIMQAEPDSRYEHPDGRVFLRTGYCCHCGACCSSGDPFVGEQTNPPSPCRLLVKDARGAFHCGDREHHIYLNGCNVWPSIPEHVAAYPSCTYVIREAR